MLRFSPANAKTYQLANTPLKRYLVGNKKIYSLDYSSALSCPGAEKCLAHIVIKNGKRKIVDGPKQEYRCFSLQQEAQYTNVYNLRQHNFNIMRQIKNCVTMAEKILSDMPSDCGILRHSVSGDIFNYEYFKALTIVANRKSNTLIYAYTKSAHFWTRYLDEFGDLPTNLVLTHSIGSKYDDIAEKYKLRTARVIYSKEEAKQWKLPIDHNDYHAAEPRLKNKDFLLLIHSSQPKGSKASKAWQKIKTTIGGYSRQ